MSVRIGLDCLRRIFQLLDTETLLRCKLVSRSFRNIIDSMVVVPVWSNWEYRVQKDTISRCYVPKMRSYSDVFTFITGELLQTRKPGARIWFYIELFRRMQSIISQQTFDIIKTIYRSTESFKQSFHLSYDMNDRMANARISSEFITIFTSMLIIERMSSAQTIIVHTKLNSDLGFFYRLHPVVVNQLNHNCAGDFLPDLMRMFIHIQRAKTPTSIRATFSIYYE